MTRYETERQIQKDEARGRGRLPGFLVCVVACDARLAGRFEDGIAITERGCVVSTLSAAQ